MRAWSLSSASLLLAACSSLEPVRGEYVKLTPLAHWTPEHTEFTCERLDWIYECMAADLDLEIPLPLTVVFEDRETAAHDGHPVHGRTTRLEDGELEIRLSAAVYDSWGGFEATVAHELTHAFLWRFELPFLVDEGMATTMEWRFFENQGTPATILKLSHGGTPVDSAHLNLTCDEAWELPEDERTRFLLSSIALVDRIGFDGLLARIKSDLGLTDAWLRRVAGEASARPRGALPSAPHGHPPD